MVGLLSCELVGGGDDDAGLEGSDSKLESGIDSVGGQGKASESPDDEVPDDPFPSLESGKGGGGSSSEDDDGPKEDVDSDCGESNFEAKPIPPNVMLVLDKSGSMYFERWMDNGVMKTRWQSLHETTKLLLETFEDKVNFGLKLFPSPSKGGGNGPSACNVEDGVDVECKEKNAKAILDVMPGPKQAVMGDTPTVTGLQEATKYLATLDDPNMEAVVLIVDGRTNCNQSNDVLRDTAATSFSKEVPVYVLGIDLDDPTIQSLEPVAVAGGTKKLHNNSDSAALVKSMEDILGNIGSCEIPLDPPPPYYDHVEVKLGKKTKVPWLEDFTSCKEAAAAGKTEGWLYHTKKPPFKLMELCGKSCDAFKSSPKVDVRYKCPPPV